ncbi:MAG: type III-B CRISPR module RAMP protein Cmr1 [Peptococcaceae bacterium]|nr:type III-B CRISPR module RAMP protein Cmr1 [Candidatus Syntrophopropionicum ammoniitolerans]
MITVNIKANTTTPVWTGDAWGEFKKLKPQSIQGALRFWFEVICYASEIDIKNYNEEKLDDKKFKSSIKQVIDNAAENGENMTIYNAKKKALHNLGVSYPSQYFGCNGWRGFIRIKSIEQDYNNQSKNPLGLKRVLYKNPEDKHKSPKWYFGHPYYFGTFVITIELEDEELKANVLYPLLRFIERYGFIGGKNNLGYGRVRFSIEEVNLSNYSSLILGVGHYVDTEKIVSKDISEFKGLLAERLVRNRKIGLYVKDDNCNLEVKKMIEELILEKSNKRAECIDKNKRHFIYGSTKKDKYKEIVGPNATKIIPWIDKAENGKYQYGYISLILLQGLKRGV